MELTSYEFTEEFKKETENANSDAMSRRSGARNQDETDGHDKDGSGKESGVGECLTAAMDDTSFDWETMSREQELDEVIGKVRSWLLKESLPTRKELMKMNRQVQSLVRRFDLLVIIKGVLAILRSHSGRKQPRVLLPRVYHSSVLKSLDDQPMT